MVQKQEELALFKKKMFRGARIVRIYEDIRTAIKTLESQLPVNHELNNSLTQKHIEGKIDGLKLALELIDQEIGQ